MAQPQDALKLWLRKSKIDGIDSSGENKPAKADGLAFGQVLQDVLQTIQDAQNAGTVAYATYSVLAAKVDLPAGSKGEVTDDPGAVHVDPVSPISHTATITIATPAVVTWAAHGRTAGDAVKFTTTGALPTGIVSGTTYYVIAAGLAANTFQVSATLGGAAINTSGSQSGVHTATFLVKNEGIYTWSASPAGWQHISDYSPATLAAAIAATNVRVDDVSLHFMLDLAGAGGINFTGVAVPPLPASPGNGLQIVAKFPVATLAGANIGGLPISLMDGTLAFDGMIAANVPTEFVLIDGTLRLRGGDTMETPVTWFNGSGTFGTMAAELLPDAPALVDWYIEPLPSGGTLQFGPGGITPGDDVEGTITIPPTGFRASDRRFATPFNLKASAANTKVSFWFATRDGRNPVADEAFDALLARNGTVFSDPWDAALRAHFTRCFAQISQLTYFNPHLGPDTAFRDENWSLNTQDTIIGSPTYNSKTGWTFAGNGGAAYIDTGLTTGSLDPHDIAMGIATVDTVAVSNSTAMAMSNYVCGIEPMRSAGIAMHACTPSTDTVSPSTRGGLCMWSRDGSATYDAYSDVEAFPDIARTGNSTTVFNMLIGVAAAISVGGPESGTYHTGKIDHAFFGKGKSASDKATIRSSRLQLLSDISGL